MCRSAVRSLIPGRRPIRRFVIPPAARPPPTALRALRVAATCSVPAGRPAEHTIHGEPLGCRNGLGWAGRAEQLATLALGVAHRAAEVVVPGHTGGRPSTEHGT
jgi:hypothetical protein